MIAHTDTKACKTLAKKACSCGRALKESSFILLFVRRPIFIENVSLIYLVPP